MIATSITPQTLVLVLFVCIKLIATLSFLSWLWALQPCRRRLPGKPPIHSRARRTGGSKRARRRHCRQL